MKNQKGYAPVLILILFILSLLGYFAFRLLVFPNSEFNTTYVSAIPSPTSTADPTINWKTYTNTEYSFSFKYPADFVVKNNLTENAITTLVNDRYKLDLYISNSTFYISIIESIKKDFDLKKAYVKIFKLGSYNVYLKSEQASGGPYSFSRTAIIKLDNKLIVLEVSPKDEEDINGTENLTDLILSTFKFMNETQGLCFYDGKQYNVNEQFKAIDGCNTCTCQGNQISCTEIACLNN